MRCHLAEHTSVRTVRFITNYLLPPPKRAVLAHLDIPLATGKTVKDEDRIPIVRKAEVDVSRVSTISTPLGVSIVHAFVPLSVRCSVVITSSGVKKWQILNAFTYWLVVPFLVYRYRFKVGVFFTHRVPTNTR